MNDINGSVKTEEQVKALKSYLPTRYTENFNFHIKRMMITIENPPQSLSSNAAVSVMGCTWISQADVMKVKHPSNSNWQEEEGQVSI